jgi:hypothetical protein
LRAQEFAPAVGVLKVAEIVEVTGLLEMAEVSGLLKATGLL